jgi:phytoene dehydrogenase-like protein
MSRICIVGAGLGGLTSGALLADKGYNVTVLEQHYVVGGAATAFKRKGYTCEVGLHEMDGLYTDKNKKRIFETLGVYDNLEFVQVPEFFRTKMKNVDFVMPENADDAIRKLSKRYPLEVRGIKKYFMTISNIAKEMGGVVRMKWWQKILFPIYFPNIYKYRLMSVKDALDGMIVNEELKMLLNSNIGYYHDYVDTFSFMYHSLGQNSYFTGGGWFIKGGSQKLSNYLAKVITDNGGEVITSADVTRLSEKRGKKIINYIHKKQEIEIEADIVISNASPMQTYKYANVDFEPEKKIVGNSLITVYIGFKNNVRSIYGKRPYSNFYFGAIDSVDSYHENLKKDITERGFIFVDYSQIDSKLTSDDKSFGVFCSVDYLKDWESLTDEEYKAKKEKLAEIYFDELEKDYPNIRDHVEFYEVGTARTMKRYLKTDNGTAYGFAATPEQFLKRPKVKSDLIENLYFTGAWVIGGGFSPAISSGGLCFRNIVKDFPIP